MNKKILTIVRHKRHPIGASFSNAVEFRQHNKRLIMRDIAGGELVGLHIGNYCKDGSFVNTSHRMGLHSVSIVMTDETLLLLHDAVNETIKRRGLTNAILKCKEQ